MSTVNDGPSDYLVVGRAPRPTTDAALTTLVTTLLSSVTAQSGGSVTGLDAVRVDASVDGPDIRLLSLDLTGVRIGLNSSSSSDSSELTDFGVVIHREDAEVREFRIRANPLVFQGVDFVLDGTVEGLRFEWATDDESRLGVGESATGAGRPRVQLRGETNTDALVSAATELLEQQFADAGVTVSDLDVDLQSVGPREATVLVKAKIRKGILSASATLEARATIDDAMVLRITEPQLSSRNPLVAALLLVTRERITEAVAEPINLNDSLPDTLQLTDIAFNLGERIRVDVTFN